MNSEQQRSTRPDAVLSGIHGRIAVIAGISVAVHLWLIFTFPIVFGGDSMARLVNRRQILLSHQLPLLQLCIYLLGRASAGVTPVRLFMSVIAALAAVGFYLLATKFLDSTAAFWGALLFATNPFLVAVSTVPYQEILMLAGLLFAFRFVWEQRWIPASLCLGLACLTRYEAWAAAPVLAFAYAQEQGFRPAAWTKSVLLFGWVPLSWIVFHHGLASSGSFVLDHSITFWRLQRLLYISWITAKETTIPTLVLALWGMALVIRFRPWCNRRFLLGGAFLLLFSIALLFSAHGDTPDPERYISSREAHIPITTVTLLAAFALRRRTRLHVGLALLSVALGSYGAFRFVQHETARPEIRLGYELAQYLDHNMGSREYVLVLARPIAPQSVKMYLAKAYELGGRAGLREARRELERVDTSPLDYQRTLIHTHLRWEQLAAFPKMPPKLDWIAVWSDFAPIDRHSAEWKRLAFANPAAMVQYGGRSVALYHAQRR
ncbi:MAG: glycosyltransferase family 39 protein [Acidobacteriaceae bacterium]|nr:glycosyltransferase family 39 protein [Acidobacteriaceae bacterium]